MVKPSHSKPVGNSMLAIGSGKRKMESVNSASQSALLPYNVTGINPLALNETSFTDKLVALWIVEFGPKSQTNADPAGPSV